MKQEAEVNKSKLIVFLALTLGLLSVVGALLLLGSRPFIAHAAPLYTDVSGHITTNTVWQLSGSPYTMTASVIVDPGVTLTIEPGVIVYGSSNTELQVQGHLEAVGTPSQPILFTSLTDNGPGQWNGLVFNGGSGYLRNVTVRYGGQANNTIGVKSNIAIQDVSEGEVRIESSTVVSEAYGGTSIGDYGIYAIDSRFVLSDTLLSGNGNDLNVDYALKAIGTCTMTVQNNRFSHNSGYAAMVDAPLLQAIHDNHFEGNGYNIIRSYGGEVSEGARLANQDGLEAYRFDNTLIVPQGITLIVESGVTARFGYAEMNVRGNLQAIGSEENPIVFTSLDDSSTGQWYGIVINGGSAHLRYTTVRYGGIDRNSLGVRSNIAIANTTEGEVRIESSAVLSEAYGGTSMSDFGIYAEASRLVISDTLIAGNGNDPHSDHSLYIINGSSASLFGLIVRNNGGSGIYVDESNATLTCSDVTTNAFNGIFLGDSGPISFQMLSSSLYGNGADGLINDSLITATATYNWWGAEDGPSGIGPGSGDTVIGSVEYDPWLTHPTCLADLALSSAATPTTTKRTQPITFTHHLINDGPNLAAEVHFTQTFTTGMIGTATVAAPVGSCSVSTDVITCTLGTMSMGDQLTITVVATPTVVGTLVSTATVDGIEDPIRPNNTTTWQITVLTDRYTLYLPIVTKGQ